VFLLEPVGIQLVMVIGQVPLCPAILVSRITSIPSMVTSTTTIRLRAASPVLGVFVLETKKFDDLMI